jgi:hypothetical protein
MSPGHESAVYNRFSFLERVRPPHPRFDPHDVNVALQSAAAMLPLEISIELHRSIKIRSQGQLW